MRQSISKYFGWRNWAVLYYNSIFENIFVFFYIVLVKEDFSVSFFISVVLFLLVSAFSTTYGYLINDYADRELDKTHGKPNTFADDSDGKALGITVSFLFVALIAAIPFWDIPLFWIIWLLWIIMTTFYSLPPLRLKERGRIGLVFVVLAQRVLPLVLVFAAFRFFELPDIILLLVYILLRGTTSDMNHQLEDYEKDLSTSTKTSAVATGRGRYQKWFLHALSAERFALFLILILMLVRIKVFVVRDISPLWLVLLLFLVIWMISLKENNADKMKKKDLASQNPYHPDKNIYQFIHLVFPNILLPGVLILLILKHCPFYAAFIIFFVLIYRLYDVDTLKKSFLKRWIS